MQSMDEQCKRCLLEKLTKTSRSTGMVAVPSGIVTQGDMDRADEAALDIKSYNPVIFRKRLCFKLSGGEQVQDPKGMQSSRLDSIWQLTEFNSGEFRSMLDETAHESD